MGRITRLCQHLDRLVSRALKVSNRKQKQKMRKAASRIRTKIRNLVDECHKQIAHWLTLNYQVILLPKFETSQMTKKTIALRKNVRTIFESCIYTFSDCFKFR
jgi:putative transposase